MRCFVAIDIEAEILGGIGRLQKGLMRRCNLSRGDVKWVDVENIHLTLKFLGEVRDNRIHSVCEQVEKAAINHEPFTINIGGLGTFGRDARVLWVGVQDCPELVRLQEDIDMRLAELEFNPENRRFSGHLTLCRIKSRKGARVITQELKDYPEGDVWSEVVESVCVYKSDLTNAGPVYTLLSKSYLG